MPAPMVVLGVAQAVAKSKLPKALAAGGITLLALGYSGLAMTSAVISGAVGPTASILEECYDRPIPAPAGESSLDASQRAIATTIVETGRSLNVPDYGLVIAIAVGLQESGLNVDPRPTLDNGSSIGVFQQLKAWGTVEERRDVVKATTMFFTGGPQPGQEGLLEIAGWEDMPLTQAAQAVQRSGFPDAYAKHENRARIIVQEIVGGELSMPGLGDCLSGPTPVLSDVECGPSGSPAEKGLQPFALGVLRCLNSAYGQHISAFYGRGSRPANPKSDHPAGRAVDAMIVDWRGPGKAKGNEAAQFVKDNAAAFRVKYIIWDAKIWSPSRAAEGWRPYRHPSGATDPTSAHKDHIHVSVHGGGVWVPPIPSVPEEPGTPGEPGDPGGDGPIVVEPGPVQPGGKPSPGNTGPRPGSKLRKSGSITVTKPGTVIENVAVNGQIKIMANNVTIRNIQLRTNTDSCGIKVENGYYGTLIERADIKMGVNGRFGLAGVCGVGDLRGKGGKKHGNNVTVRHSKITGLADGIKAVDYSLYERNYIKMWRPKGSSAHTDGIQGSGRSYFTIRYNTIGEKYVPGDNAAIFIQAFTGKRENHIRGIRIYNNWLNGGGYTFHSEDGKKSSGYFHDIVVKDNIFTRRYKYGVVHADGPISGGFGVWADNGKRVPTGQIR